MKTLRGMRAGTVLLFLVFLLEARGADGPDLSGVVRTAEGEPLKGARVFIYTAGPREGTGVLCPSCYPDCRNRAVTDEEGKFLIEDLDASLLFRVLVAAPGYQPSFVARVDPASGPIESKVKAVSKAETADRQMRGRVVDLSGKPVSGAVVNIRGVSRGSGTRFGGNADVDPLAVTDDEGAFVIHGENEFDAVGVDVEARGFAKAIFQKLETGGMVHELKIGEGATVKGRVVKGGLPVGGAELGISGSERRSEIYAGNATIAADAFGNFLFSNVTPETSYELYGLMKALRSKGAIPTRTIQVGKHGSVLDVGDINLEEGFTVAGVVRLADGKELPAKTRVMLGREKAWDSDMVEVDAEGRFRFEGVPLGGISMSARAPGYRLSMRNGSLDPLNPSLIGQVIGNKTNLVIELEPGSGHQRYGGEQVAIREAPIRGAEGAEKIALGITVSGTVTDAESGKALEKFDVVEGSVADFPPDTVNWFETRKTEFKDGRFEMTFPMPMKGGRGSVNAVMIMAEGYLPQKAGVLSSSTNLTFALKKGAGPAGILLKPDGSPAGNVAVFLTDMRNGVYIDGQKVREQIYRGTRKATTDEAGRFSFAGAMDPFSVVVADDAGFLEVRVEELGAEKEFRLQPWARLEGKLMIGEKPGGHEEIRMSVAHQPYVNHPRQFPALNFYANTKTEGDGTFVFERVPPIKVEVYHSPKVKRGSGSGTVPQSQSKKLALEPGATATVALGGVGRPVIGKAVLNGYEGNFDWRDDAYTITFQPPQPAGLPDMREEAKKRSAKNKELMALPEEERKAAFEAMSRKFDAMQEKTREFYKTEESWEYYAAQSRYAMKFDEGGAFRIEDVPPGKYKLHMFVREKGGPGGKMLGMHEQEFEVPAGDRSEPFDVGTLEVSVRGGGLKTGKVAPDFETKTVADEPLKLADFRGKYVLLDFWAVWCGPCVAETPHLKETFEAFKDNPKFAMIGLSLDPKKAAPIEYAKKNELGWIQGFLGDWDETKVPGQFGVDGIPAIFLIDPEGKIVESGLRGPAIRAAVAKALGNSR